MKRFVVYTLIACFALLLALPLAGCNKSSNSSSTGSDKSSTLGGHNKDINNALNGE